MLGKSNVKKKEAPVEVVGRYFKTRKGKRVLTLCACLLVFILGYSLYSSGSDLRKGIKNCRRERRRFYSMS